MSEKRVAFVVPVQLAKAPAEDGTRSFSGIAYSGGVVTDHPFYDAIVIDLATTKFKTPAPLLYSHDQTAPIGKIARALVDNQIEISGGLFAGDDTAEMVASKSDQGMPWQMSVGVFPGSVEQVKAGTTVEVNGQKLDGPLAVFRNNRIREVSICALGADGNTSAEIFVIGGNEPRQLTGAPSMDQVEHDRIVGELNVKIAGLAEENAKQAEKLAALDAEKTASLAAARKESIKTLGTKLAKEFTAAEQEAFEKMDATTFEFVSGQMLAAKPGGDPSLFEAHATDQSAAQGEGADPEASALQSAENIRMKAREYITAQAKVGIEVGVADAVSFVTRKPK